MLISRISPHYLIRQKHNIQWESLPPHTLIGYCSLCVFTCILNLWLYCKHNNWCMLALSNRCRWNCRFIQVSTYAFPHLAGLCSYSDNATSRIYSDSGRIQWMPSTYTPNSHVCLNSMNRPLIRVLSACKRDFCGGKRDPAIDPHRLEQLHRICANYFRWA